MKTEAKQFNKLMNTGKFFSTIAKLTDTSKAFFLLDVIVKVKTVEHIFIEKHPPSELIDDNSITPVPSETTPFYASIFDQIKSQQIKKAAMRMQASHGPTETQWLRRSYA